MESFEAIVNGDPTKCPSKFLNVGGVEQVLRKAKSLQAESGQGVLLTMATMQVEVVSPEKVLFSGEAKQQISTLGGGEIAFSRPRRSAARHRVPHTHHARRRLVLDVAAGDSCK